MHWAQLPGGERERGCGRAGEKEKKAEYRLRGILIKCSTQEKEVRGRQWQLSGAAKLLLNLIQYSSICVFLFFLRLRASIYVDTRTTVCTVYPQARKRKSYRILHLRYSYALRCYGPSIRLSLSLSLFFDSGWIQRDREVALAWLKGQ